MIFFLKGVQVSNKHSCVSGVSFEIRRQVHDIYFLCVLIYIWNAVMPSWFWPCGSWQLKKTKKIWMWILISKLSRRFQEYPYRVLFYLSSIFYILTASAFLQVWMSQKQKQLNPPILFWKIIYLLHTITGTK